MRKPRQEHSRAGNARAFVPRDLAQKIGERFGLAALGAAQGVHSGPPRRHDREQYERHQQRYPAAVADFQEVGGEEGEIGDEENGGKR